MEPFLSLETWTISIGRLMKRYGNYSRREGVRNSRLIIIAAEGECTETIYFKALRDYAQNSRVHIVLLEREEKQKHNSSPEFVFAQLSRYKSENPIEYDDELWLVIDRDKWSLKSLKIVAQNCAQDSVCHLALSNPCFELWLLLHFVDVEMESDDEKILLLHNAKIGASTTYLQRRMQKVLPGYKKSNYAADVMVMNVKEAIRRAEHLDVNKRTRW